MALNINGTTGISGVDGSASAPALQGTDSNTGINFASDTVNINTGGVTRATVDSSGALDVPTDFPIKVNGSEKLRIDSSGNVGIGVTDVKAALQVNSDKNAETDRFDGSNYHLFLRNPQDDTGEACGLAFSVTTNATKTGAAIMHEREGGGSIGSMQFYTNGDGNQVSERMRILSDGRMQIMAQTFGTTVGSSNSGLQLADTNNASLSAAGGTTTANHFIFINPNGTVGRIQTSGTGTTFLTSSDYRLKENAVSISDGITRLKTLKPYRFNFKKDASTTLDGFFAHEVQTAVPQAVDGTKDELYTEDNKFGEYEAGDPKYQSLDHSKLVPLLTAALQEAIAKIEVLETKVAALEAG